MALIRQLETLHGALEAAISALEAEAARPRPDEPTLAMARLAVTRASSRRKALIDCVVTAALHHVPAEDARRISELRSTDVGMAVESAEHIVRWTTANITSDWNGYRRAWAEMRKSLLERIAQEKTVFYPLLRK